MHKEIPLKLAVGPILFSIAVYLSWTFGRLFFCGIEVNNFN
jgi:hypothetical protein